MNESKQTSRILILSFTMAEKYETNVESVKIYGYCLLINDEEIE